MRMILGTILIMATTSAFAGDWDKSQHNFTLKGDQFDIQVRNETSSDKDHMQLSYKPYDGVKLDYRYTDDEQRYRAGLSVGEGSFKMTARLEYRDMKSGEDYARLRTVFNYSDASGVWGEFTPTFNLNKDGQSIGQFDGTQTKIGYEFKITESAKFGPFVQYETDSDWNKTSVFLGTGLTARF